MKIITNIPSEVALPQNIGKEVPLYFNDKEVGVSKVVELDGELKFESTIFPQNESLIELKAFGHIKKVSDGKIDKLELNTTSIQFKDRF